TPSDGGPMSSRERSSEIVSDCAVISPRSSRTSDSVSARGMNVNAWSRRVALNSFCEALMPFCAISALSVALSDDASAAATAFSAAVRAVVVESWSAIRSWSRRLISARIAACELLIHRSLPSSPCFDEPVLDAVGRLELDFQCLDLSAFPLPLVLGRRRTSQDHVQPAVHGFDDHSAARPVAASLALGVVGIAFAPCVGQLAHPLDGLVGEGLRSIALVPVILVGP